ncbi:MAG: alpha/beta hydrolase family protein [Corynebacterium sp.]|nr:alpha/beta hydrolase family protein [Corynebacterium sp.]
MTRSIIRAITATLLVLATIGGQTAVARADVANRDWLRPDATGTCEWDAANYWVQRCDVYSPSMGTNITVLVQPSQRGGDAAFYLLDGMRAETDFTGWVNYANAPATYVDSNITLVMPLGGAGSFYTNWDSPASFSTARGTVYKWDTFLSAELPAYLQHNFGVNPTRNAIGGVSMGGTAALSLGARHNQQFRQVLSYSGYAFTTLPGMETLIRLALIDSGGYNLSAMYTTLLNPRRYVEDPFWNMGALRGSDVYISTSFGIPNGGDLTRPINEIIMGFGLEQMAFYTSILWMVKALLTGVRFTMDVTPTGIHNWGIWTDQLNKTKARVLDYFQAW